MSASPAVSKSFLPRASEADKPDWVDMSAVEGRPIKYLVLQGAVHLARYMSDGGEFVIDGIRFARVGKTLLVQPANQPKGETK